MLTAGRATARRRLGNRWTAVGFLAAILLFSICIATGMGAVRIHPLEVAQIALGHVPWLGLLVPKHWPETHDLIVYQVRLPRVVVASVVGWALGLAGAAFQGLFRNPMADPYVVGVSSGAALGATLAIAAGTWVGRYTVPIVPPMAFVGAMATAFTVYALARVGSRVPIGGLLLAGAAVSAFAGAVVSFLITLSNDDLRAIVYWLMGSLSGKGWEDVGAALPYTVLGSLGLLALARPLNVISFGEDSAHTLGIPVERAKAFCIVAGSLITAAAVATTGIIGFIGLIVPHAVRIVVGPDHRVLLPAAGLAGAIALVLADWLARLVIAPAEVPVGIITALLGAPFFIVLLRRQGRRTGRS